MVSKSSGGSAGRFGPRYGSRLRKKISLVEKVQKKRQTCPACKKDQVRRVSKGIWQCKKCNHKFAGGAYVPFKNKEVKS